MDKYTIAPPAGSTNNSVGAGDRPWKEGHFEKLPGINEYLAESTGYGIVSGCEPTISGLTVTIGAGIVHLADGTRKEIASTNITLDAADSTNPRVDLVYIDSTGVVAKVTGTAAASPSAPDVPSGCISVCNVTIAAGASAGTLTDSREFLKRKNIVAYVDDFGAKGDGVTDDTNAINNALNAGDMVIFSPKTYMINDKGIRPKNGNILIGNGATLKEITNGLTNYSIIKLHRVIDVKIDGFILSGERDTHTGSTGEWGHCIFMETAKNVVVSNCTLENGWGDGILIDSYNQPNNAPCENIVVKNCTIDNNRRNGVSCVCYTDVLIDNCTITRTNGTEPQSGVEVERTGSSQVTGKIIVRNCTFDDNLHAVKVFSFSDDFDMLVENCSMNGGFSVLVYSNAGESKGCFIFKNNTIKTYHRTLFNIARNNNDESYIYLLNNIVLKGSTFTGEMASAIDNLIAANSDYIKENIYVDGLHAEEVGKMSSVWMDAKNCNKLTLKNVEFFNEGESIYNNAALRTNSCTDVLAKNIPIWQVVDSPKTISSDGASSRCYFCSYNGNASITISSINNGDEFTITQAKSYNLTVTLPNSQQYKLTRYQTLKVKKYGDEWYEILTNGTLV